MRFGKADALRLAPPGIFPNQKAASAFSRSLFQIFPATIHFSNVYCPNSASLKASLDPIYSVGSRSIHGIGPGEDPDARDRGVWQFCFHAATRIPLPLNH